MPTENQIKDAVKAIKKQLQQPQIDSEKNAGIKEGYTKALDILSKPDIIWIYAQVEELKTVQGRAIAILAIDFLDAKCSHKHLCKIPIL